VEIDEPGQEENYGCTPKHYKAVVRFTDKAQELIDLTYEESINPGQDL
jgi:hypothetical protein